MERAYDYEEWLIDYYANLETKIAEAETMLRLHQGHPVIGRRLNRQGRTPAMNAAVRQMANAYEKARACAPQPWMVATLLAGVIRHLEDAEMRFPRKAAIRECINRVGKAMAILQGLRDNLRPEVSVRLCERLDLFYKTNIFPYFDPDAIGVQYRGLRTHQGRYPEDARRLGERGHGRNRKGLIAAREILDVPTQDTTPEERQSERRGSRLLSAVATADRGGRNG